MDQAILERATDGLSITDCANVKFAPDVPLELIRERLWSVADCAHVACTPEQASVIRLVAEAVASINHSPMEKETEDDSCITINTVSYQF